MTSEVSLGGRYTLPGTSISLTRIGYGVTRLMGPQVWGGPSDRDNALAVLRDVALQGINHIDTCECYGPHIANQLIREALHPYPKDMKIITKIGVRRGPDKSWPAALSPQDLREAVEDNLRNLRLDALDVVNLRLGEPFSTNDDSLREPLEAMIDLKRQGLIRHIGLSNITRRQFDEAQAMTEIVCVQNRYNLLDRQDDDFIDDLARQNIAFVPFFPLGGFQPFQSDALDRAAASLGATTRQVAIAWLLQRSPNIVVIAGTSSITHLRENLSVASLTLPPEIVADLNQAVSK
jgi:aryl-alcohol dehydrogenase-like predicted oxidoreductase